MTSAAVIMVAVFAVFGTLTMQQFKQLSVGLAVAVLLDATVVRGVLLPSVMTLLGDRNWYRPRWLSHIVTRGDNHGSVLQAHRGRADVLRERVAANDLRRDRGS